jgi:hypothetical protein
MKLFRKTVWVALALGMLPAVFSMAEPANPVQKKAIVTRIDPNGKPSHALEEEGGTWLGVGVEEVPDVLSVQLKLKPGEGLIVNFVASNSPAATAGLAKNDLLLRWEDQVLVHPEQLRKLVRNSKSGDEVKLTAIQAGEKREISLSLTNTPPGYAAFGSDSAWAGEWIHKGRNLTNFPFRVDMKNLRESLARAGIDRETLTRDISRNVEEARKAVLEAMRMATNNLNPASESVARILKELARAQVNLDKQVSVSVHNNDQKVQTMVQSDDTGTYTLVADPKPRITIHDSEGKLVFDGRVGTPEEMDKVPENYRKRVESMVEKLGDNREPQTEE